MEELLLYFKHIGAPGAYWLGCCTSTLLVLVVAVVIWWFGKEPVYKWNEYGCGIIQPPYPDFTEIILKCNPENMQSAKTQA